MAKQTQTPPPLLVKSKQGLKELIRKRKFIGEELLNIPVSTLQENNELWLNFLSWDKVNYEIIASAFNQSRHKHEYEYKYKQPIDVLGAFNVERRQKSLQEEIDENKNAVRSQLRKLQDFHDIIDHQEYIPEFKLPAPEFSKEIPVNSDFKNLVELLSKFHRVAVKLRHRHADRATLQINDEYDVQDLLDGLLQVHFEDVMPEDHTPVSAGASSRIDFVLKQNGILLEVKMTNENLKDKKLGEELLIDIGRYKSYLGYNNLVIFIYDRGEFIHNRPSLKRDLEQQSSANFKVTVVINP